MKSLTDLQALARDADVPTHNPDGSPLHRSEIMDLLREKTGTFDPSLQLDPAKAVDLKNKIAWEKPSPERWEGIAKKYLHAGWALEPKLDGARMRVFLGTMANTMNTGRRSDVTFAYHERADNFPHLRDCAIPELAGVILDGELMPPKASITTVSGVTTKGTLNSAMALVNVNPADAVTTQEREGKAIFVAFDILAVDGESTLHLPWQERRVLLDRCMDVLELKEPCFQRTAVMDATAQNLDQLLELGLEGGMLKDRTAPYLPGKRMAAWAKVKVMSTGDFFIIGSVDGKGKNAGLVGSLKVAYAGPGFIEPFDAVEWTQPKAFGAAYCADVGGFTDAFRRELTGPDGKVDPAFVGKVIEVMAQGYTGKNNRLRHPHFVRLRPDKSPADCGPEQLFQNFTEV